VRTTLTIDPDVAVQLKRAMRSRGETLKDTVNAALRAGLALLATAPTQEPFSVHPLDLGPSLVGSLDNIEEVLARVEGEKHP
jgi:hypothetical protein